ncbi:MAG TPA: hypothetical protein QF753_08495 [Victivallales bacterium]|nr:hypothetical protein [Victivallales bacterium]
MNDKSYNKSVIPFIIMLIVSVFAITYAVLFYFRIPCVYFQIMRSIISLGLLFMFFISIKRKQYIHTVFFAYLTFTANPFLDIGYFSFTVHPGNLLYWLEILKYISIIFFIYFCFYYYPHKRKY